MLSYCPGTPQKQNVIRLYGAYTVLITFWKYLVKSGGR